MVAVCGHQHVVVVQRPDRAHVRGLLARGQMAVAADLRGLVLALGLGLEGPDEEHQLEQLPQPRAVAGLGRALLGLNGLVEVQCVVALGGHSPASGSSSRPIGSSSAPTTGTTARRSARMRAWTSASRSSGCTASKLRWAIAPIGVWAVSYAWTSAPATSCAVATPHTRPSSTTIAACVPASSISADASWMVAERSTTGT